MFELKINSLLLLVRIAVGSLINCWSPVHFIFPPYHCRNLLLSFHNAKPNLFGFMS